MLLRPPRCVSDLALPLARALLGWGGKHKALSMARAAHHGGAWCGSPAADCTRLMLRVGRRCLTPEPAAAGFMPPEPRLEMEGMLGGGRGGHHSCRGQLFPVLLP